MSCNIELLIPEELKFLEKQQWNGRFTQKDLDNICKSNRYYAYDILSLRKNNIGPKYEIGVSEALLRDAEDRYIHDKYDDVKLSEPRALDIAVYRHNSKDYPLLTEYVKEFNEIHRHRHKNNHDYAELTWPAKSAYEPSRTTAQFAANEFFNRMIPLNGNEEQELLKQLPSLIWIKAQRDYLISLSDEDFLLLNRYTSVVAAMDKVANLNKYGHKQLTLEEASVISASQIFSADVEAGISYNEFILNYRKRINQLIMDAPPLDKSIHVMRFSSREGKIDMSTKIKTISAFTSTSIETENHAPEGGADDVGGYEISIHIIIPKGGRCLYLPAVSDAPYEFEILLPYGATFYVYDTFDQQLSTIWAQDTSKHTAYRLIYAGIRWNASIDVGQRRVKDKNPRDTRAEILY